jgi:hypothetical protein
MFEASVDGEPYDMERWGQYFKPAGLGQNTGDPVKTPAATTRAAAPAAEAAPWEDDVAIAEAAMTKPAAAAPAATGGRAEDILAMIRNRKTQ